jgi:predicted nucleic acid-binding protein
MDIMTYIELTKTNLRDYETKLKDVQNEPVNTFVRQQLNRHHQWVQFKKQELNKLSTTDTIHYIVQQANMINHIIALNLAFYQMVLKNPLDSHFGEGQ